MRAWRAGDIILVDNPCPQQRMGFYLRMCRLALGNHVPPISSGIAGQADNVLTSSSMHSLEMLYLDQGKLAKAEKMYQRALQGKEKALGADHTLALQTVNNLGLLYRNQGKLAEAEKMYQRALSGYERALGADHISTLETISNLGNFYNEQSKLAEAEKMRQRARRRHLVQTMHPHLTQSQLGHSLPNSG
jgi:tetratricopeptide (TPR) repeat protein